MEVIQGLSVEELEDKKSSGGWVEVSHEESREDGKEGGEEGEGGEGYGGQVAPSPVLDRQAVHTSRAVNLRKLKNNY